MQVYREAYGRDRKQVMRIIVEVDIFIGRKRLVQGGCNRTVRKEIEVSKTPAME